MEDMKMKMNKNMTTATSAGIGGALVGAGIAAVATRVLSDKKNREKAGKVLGGIKNKIAEVARKDAENSKTVKSISKSASEAKSKAKNGVVASTKIKEEAKEALQPKAASKAESKT